MILFAKKLIHSHIQRRIQIQKGKILQMKLYLKKHDNHWKVEILKGPRRKRFKTILQKIYGRKVFFLIKLRVSKQLIA